MPESPGHFCSGLEQFDHKAYWQLGARGLLLDLDNSSTGFNEHRFYPGAEERVELCEEDGFYVIIGTNNPRDRSHLTRGKRGYVSTRNRRDLVRRQGKPHDPFFDQVEVVARANGLRMDQFVSLGDCWTRDSRGALLAGMLDAVTFDRRDKDPLFEWFLMTRYFETLALREYTAEGFGVVDCQECIERIDGQTIHVPELYLPERFAA